MLVSDVQCQQQNIMRLRGNDNEITVMPINVSDKNFELKNGLLFARPLKNDSVMSLTISDKHESYSGGNLKDIQHPIVLSTIGRVDASFGGEWAIETLTMSHATTLFSFLDYQAKYRRNVSEKTEQKQNGSILVNSERSLVLLMENANKSMMGMLLSTLLDPQDRRLESLFTFIRNLESYWIAHFLLSMVMNEDKESDSHKIVHASKIYGVSESYFRKLCHHAFTRGPKKQLRLWRAAHSALQLIEKDNSIAAIAGNNGYASSSHFSSEIKSLFGITPREFKKLEGLLHE